jgi:hypothetical protein
MFAQRVFRVILIAAAVIVPNVSGVVLLATCNSQCHLHHCICSSGCTKAGEPGGGCIYYEPYHAFTGYWNTFMHGNMPVNESATTQPWDAFDCVCSCGLGGAYSEECEGCVTTVKIGGPVTRYKCMDPSTP